MVGGDEASRCSRRGRCSKRFGGLIVHLGGVGAGQMAKLINNTLLTANMALAHDALTPGRRSASTGRR